MRKLLAVILSLSLIIAPVPAIASGAYAKQILGLANGILGSTIISSCTLGQTQTSVMLYMAGSMVYVASEIMGAKGKASNIDGLAARLDQLKEDMKDGGDYQKAVIQAQLDDEKSNLDFIQKRRRWILATKAIYAAATAMAILEYWWSFPAPLGMGKPDAAACTTSDAESRMVKYVAMAYSSLMSTGGNLKGMAVMMASQAAVKEFLPTLTGVTKAASVSVMSLMNSSLGRATFFAGAAALVQIIDTGLATEERNSKKKIADIEKLRDDFSGATKDINSLAEGESTIEVVNNTYAVTALPKGTELTKHCFSNANGKMDFSEDGCKSAYQFSRPKFDVKMNLPTLVAGVNAAIDLGQAISNGDMASADVAAGSLTNMAGRLDTVRDGLMKKLNDKLVADGKKPIDSNAELQRQIDALNKGLDQTTPGSGNVNLATLKGEANLSDDKINAADANRGAEGEAQTTKNVSPVNSAAMPDINLDQFTEDSLASEGSAFSDSPEFKHAVARISNNPNDYKPNDSEISDDVDVSIFKQVSQRYFFNYQKIFNRKKIESTPTPASNEQ